MNSLIFFPLIILVVIGNVLWYTIKSILSENGYKVNYWYGHFKDIANFKDLINKTNNPREKSKYSKMYWGLIITLFFFILMGIVTFANQ